MAPAASLPPLPLSASERRALRAAAHHLDPVVMIGDAGLSDAVVAEADRALTAHELVKIRVLGEDRAARHAMLERLCAELGCQPVQEIGKLLVVYRPRPPEEPRRYVPKKRAALGLTSAPRAARSKAAPSRTSTRTRDRAPGRGSR